MRVERAHMGLVQVVVVVARRYPRSEANHLLPFWADRKVLSVYQTRPQIACAYIYTAGDTQ